MHAQIFEFLFLSHKISLIMSTVKNHGLIIIRGCVLKSRLTAQRRHYVQTDELITILA